MHHQESSLQYEVNQQVINKYFIFTIHIHGLLTGYLVYRAAVTHEAKH